MQGPPPGNGPYGPPPHGYPQQAQGAGQAPGHGPPHPQQGYPTGPAHPQQGQPQQPQHPQQGQPRGYPHQPQGYPSQQGHAPPPAPAQGYPPPGHPPPPRGQHGPLGYAQPVLGHPAPGRAVSGVPLEPGERVIYFRKVEQWGGRIFRIVAGIALMPFLVGFFILYAVFSDMPGEPDAQAITNKRILSMKSSGKIIEELRWEQVAGFTKVLRRAAMATMAVRDAQGPKILFAEDGPWLEKALPAWLEAGNREQSPEVPFA